MKKLLTSFLKSATPSQSALHNKEEAEPSKAEVVPIEQVKAQRIDKPQDKLILKNFAKQYVDMRVLFNYHQFNLGQQNLEPEQKEVIEKVHYAVKNDTPIRYELIQRLDPELTRQKLDMLQKVDRGGEESKYVPMYDPEVEAALGGFRKWYMDNASKQFRRDYH